MYGLNEFIEKWQQDNNYSWNYFWLMFGTFIDHFRKNKDIKIVKREPTFNNQVPKEIKAFIASSVDALCNEENISSPNWVYNQKYILKEPFFPSELKGEIRAIMLIESPIEFKVKNIYVTKNVLKRI